MLFKYNTGRKFIKLRLQYINYATLLSFVVVWWGVLLICRAYVDKKFVSTIIKYTCPFKKMYVFYKIMSLQLHNIKTFEVIMQITKARTKISKEHKRYVKVRCIMELHGD